MIFILNICQKTNFFSEKKNAINDYVRLLLVCFRTRFHVTQADLELTTNQG